ncbi:hypothetical protein HYH03_008202 [Edaphochlamys debaryana]|uniref:phytol kinase n=1 Tax=Edaphochlamys debaryana TaxID=47281 RepID=A0A835Y2X0_9CHLO|nr:hypothetical protein HYH03_008202 [Edaphochlamys debaryana]|eukprot:KAG2493688.1 hypothetical protein HYH03_008202 [Edaphochlamys debaryana]
MAALSAAVKVVVDRSSTPDAQRMAEVQISTYLVPSQAMLKRCLNPLHTFWRAILPRADGHSAALFLQACPMPWQLEWLSAAADTLRACTQYACFTAQQDSRERERQGQTGAMAAANFSTESATQLAAHAGMGMSVLLTLLAPPTGSGVSGGPAQEQPAAFRQLLSALAGSGLLPAVAAAALRTPGPDPDRARNGDQDSQISALYVANCAGYLQAALHIARQLMTTPGAGAAPLAGVFAQPDVAAFQEALVERLCVHGGVELEPGEGGGQGQGRWWLPQLEAKVGHVIGSPNNPREWNITGTAEVYAEVHRTTMILLFFQLYPSACYMLTADDSFAEFSAPPARLLRLESKAWEAVCRLYRGQGLAGSYGPKPAWDCMPCPDPFMNYTPRAESAAWALALCVEAVEAELDGRHWGNFNPFRIVSKDVSQAQRLHGVAGALHALLRMVNYGLPSPEKLGAASREELQAQLCRAGLATSLNHALRQAFTAADRAATSGSPELQRLATDLSAVPICVAQVHTLRALPLPNRIDDGGALVTFAKRAAMMTQRLQELEAAGSAEARRQERDLLAALLHNLLPAASCFVSTALAAGEAASEQGSGGALQADPEVAALLGRSVCLLVTQVLARSVLRRVGAATSKRLLEEACAALDYLRWACTATVLALSTPRLLACQPPRLLAATCKLLCADLTPSEVTGSTPEAAGKAAELPSLAAVQVLYCLLDLSAHPQLGDRVRTWLAPPEGSGGGGATADGACADQGAAAERGCLEPLVRSGVLSRLSESEADTGGAALLSLLRAAVAENGEAPGGFQAHARSIREEIQAGTISVVRVGGAEHLVLPGSDLEDMIARELSEQEGTAALPDVTALVAAPLPPPLAVPLAEAALRELRVCAYPGCLSYGGRSEAGLSLKQCARCKCVRYCGAACQAAHWKAGHKEECQAAAAAAAAPGAPPA